MFSTQTDRFFHGLNKRNTKFVQTSKFNLEMTPSKRQRRNSHSKSKNSRLFQKSHNSSLKASLNQTMKVQVDKHCNTGSSLGFLPPSSRKNASGQSTDRNIRTKNKQFETQREEEMKIMSALKLKNHLRSKIETNALKRYTNFYQDIKEDHKIQIVSENNVKHLLDLLNQNSKHEGGNPGFHRKISKKRTAFVEHQINFQMQNQRKQTQNVDFNEESINEQSIQNQPHQKFKQIHPYDSNPSKRDLQKEEYLEKNKQKKQVNQVTDAQLYHRKDASRLPTPKAQSNKNIHINDLIQEDQSEKIKEENRKREEENRKRQEQKRIKDEENRKREEQKRQREEENTKANEHKQKEKMREKQQRIQEERKRQKLKKQEKQKQRERQLQLEREKQKKMIQMENNRQKQLQKKRKQAIQQQRIKEQQHKKKLQKVQAQAKEIEKKEEKQKQQKNVKKGNSFWNSVNEESFVLPKNKQSDNKVSQGGANNVNAKKVKTEARSSYNKNTTQKMSSRYDADQDELEDVDIGTNRQISVPQNHHRKTEPDINHPSLPSHLKNQELRDEEQFQEEIDYYLNLIDTVGEYHIKSKKFYEKGKVKPYKQYKITSYNMWQQLYYLRQLTIDTFDKIDRDWFTISQAELQLYKDQQFLQQKIIQLKEENKKCHQTIQKLYKQAKQLMEGRQRVFSIDKKVNYHGKCMKLLQQEFKEVQKNYKTAFKNGDPIENNLIERLCYLIEVYCLLKHLNGENTKDFMEVEDISNLQNHYKKYKHLITL